MADHETSGAQEWQLPGYGRVKSKAPAALPGENQQSALRTIQNHRGAGRYRGLTQPAHLSARRGGSPSKPATTTNAGRSRWVARASRGRGTQGPVRGPSRFIRTPLRNPGRFPRDSPAKMNWRAGAEPTGTFELPGPFGTFRRELFGVARGTFNRTHIANKGRFEVLEDICQKTGAYIKPPLYTDQVICLWGEPAQVSAAQELLQQLVTKCKASSQKKKAEWAKINAHSSTKEAVIDRREKHEVIIQQLRRAPDPSINFPERLLFLWPAEELPMKDFLGPDLGALDFIRAEFGYHLYIPDGFPNYICVAGHDHEVIREIVRRLRNKWSELMASANIRSKVYLVEPPENGYMRNGIVVKNSPPFAKPFLYGHPLKDLQLATWYDRTPLIRSKNDIRLLNATERSLRGLPFFRGHLRMRVNLGSFVLDEYRLPRDGKSAYSFEEFREMLLNDGTRGRLLPGLEPSQNELLDRCFQASHILAPISNTLRSLADAEPAYSVNFEFSGADSALLRLEAEFSKHYGAQEYEVTQRRWVKAQGSGHSDNRSPLQIAVIDFERSDWQLEIKALEFYDKSTVDAALKTFSHSIRFKSDAAAGGISATPKRKVMFPESAPVSRVVEKTAIRYKIKGTEYTLEIARYDEYSRMGLQISQGRVQTTNPGAMSEVPVTTWGASIYDLSWDNLLGQQANMGVGHAASWNPNLNTFFRPKRQPVDPTDSSSGFWEFIAVVKEVAGLLGPRKADPPKKAQSDTANKETVRDVSPSVTKPKTAASHISSSSSLTADGPKTIKLLDADLGTLF